MPGKEGSKACYLQEWALTPKPAFVYRTIGGVLDMYFFLGPSPSDTASQYAQAVGENNNSTIKTILNTCDKYI